MLLMLRIVALIWLILKTNLQDIDFQFNPSTLFPKARTTDVVRAFSLFRELPST